MRSQQLFKNNKSGFLPIYALVSDKIFRNVLNKQKMQIIIILVEVNSFDKVNFSSCWEYAKKKHRNLESNENKLKKKHQKITCSFAFHSGHMLR